MTSATSIKPICMYNPQASLFTCGSKELASKPKLLTQENSFFLWRERERECDNIVLLCWCSFETLYSLGSPESEMRSQHLAMWVSALTQGPLAAASKINAIFVLIYRWGCGGSECLSDSLKSPCQRVDPKCMSHLTEPLLMPLSLFWLHGSLPSFLRS